MVWMIYVMWCELNYVCVWDVDKYMYFGNVWNMVEYVCVKIELDWVILVGYVCVWDVDKYMYLWIYVMRIEYVRLDHEN